MRTVTMAAVVMAVIPTLVSGPLDVQPPVLGGHAPVPVNSQTSLTEIVGGEFAGDAAWEYPNGLLPADFAGLAYVSGPADPDLCPKVAWRMSVSLRDKDNGVEVAINCYRARDKKDEQGKGAGPRTPVIPLTEPDHKHTKAELHELRAALASKDEQEVFAFRDGDLLFKVRATGGKLEARRKAVDAAADAVWKFRHPK